MNSRAESWRAYVEEERRAFDQQRDDVRDLRTRVVTVVTLAGTVVGFAAALYSIDQRPSLTAHRSDAYILSAWTGILAFVAVVLCAITVLWPRSFQNVLNHERLQGAVDEANSSDHYLKSLGHALASARTANGTSVAMLYKAFTGCLVAFLVEIVAIGAWMLIR